MDYPKSEPGVALLNGKFTDGNPLLGVPASRDPSSWANAVTDEVIAVIADGAETPEQQPTEGSNNQMIGAIKRIWARLFGERVATQALVDAGTDDATLVTPKKLRWGFAASWTTNGYVTFPTWLGGLVLQWGEVAFNHVSNNFLAQTVTFPIAFTARLMAVLAMPSQATLICGASNYSLNSVYLQSADRDANATPTIVNTVRWFAVGK